MKKTCLILLAFVIFSACSNDRKESETPAFYHETDEIGLKDGNKGLVSNASSPADETNDKITFASSVRSSEESKDDYHKNEEKKEESIDATKVGAKIPAKIRKTAYLNITVEDYKKARAAIEKFVKSGNAYIGSEDEQNTTYAIYNTMVIRVVNKDFDVMVNNVAGIASHVNSKNVTAEDVTAQFVDIQTRLKSKKEIEQRYISILQKAAKVTDILEIEQKLGEIREEIEAKEGELKYLSDQVDYSTISLTFAQNFEYTPQDRPGFWGRTGSAFEKGWDGFLGFIVGLIYVWPLLLILLVGTYFLVRFIKRKLKK